MSVSIKRWVVGWAMVVILPFSLLGQSGSSPGGAAILHTQGGVWVNGYEAADATAIFPGDVLETKPGFSANLSLDGSTVLVQPESVAKFQGDLLVLDHGSVSVGTSKRFKVRVNCLTAVPVLTEWTQYEVTDTNRTVLVTARKLDVNVEREMGRGKPSPETEASRETTVHEGQQGSYEESEVCGAPPRPRGAGTIMEPKWIAAGAGGVGVLIWLLVHGGGKTPLSTSQP